MPEGALIARTLFRAGQRSEISEPTLWIWRSQWRAPQRAAISRYLRASVYGRRCEADFAPWRFWFRQRDLRDYAARLAGYHVEPQKPPWDW